MSRGYLISFEGLDGAGKTTQIDLLVRWFKEQSLPYKRTREPGGTSLGIEIRNLLFNRSDITLTPLAEAFLFQADRAQHFATLILPLLAQGTHVITDRCFDSSIAYQGAARGVGEALVERLSLIATQDYQPDLTLLLDLDPANVGIRTDITRNPGSQREHQSRFDTESEQFQLSLRTAFMELAHKYPARIKVIDASLTPEQVHQHIVRFVSELLYKE
ncbi:MAG: dTMP kinase [Ktedonobacteraceae bacterium]|nr:dTMP kinase [Ktedonobacteraceae bacterium]